MNESKHNLTLRQRSKKERMKVGLANIHYEGERRTIKVPTEALENNLPSGLLQSSLLVHLSVQLFLTYVSIYTNGMSC